MLTRGARPWLLGAMYLALSAAFCAYFFALPNGLGINDWDQHLFYYGSVLKNLIEYGQAPFWNPWYCGGDVLWENPQIAILSPAYPLALVMPLALAMKLNIVLHYWIGFVGMHLLLTRVVRLSYLPAVVYVAVLATAAGAPAIHLAAGHSVFLPGFYMPLQLFLLMRGFETGAVRPVLLAAGLLALMVWNGGVHVLPMALAAVGVLSLALAALRRQWRPLIVAAVFCTAGPLLAAPKLLPVSLYVASDHFWDTRNPTEHPDRVTPAILRQTYLTPTSKVGARLEGQREGWHEYGNYVGLFSAVLLVAGLGWTLWGRGVPNAPLARATAITALALFTISLGEFAAWAPASLLHHVPLFSSFRIPSRYTIVFELFAAIALGFALRAAAIETRARAVRLGIAAVLLGASAHLLWTNGSMFKGVFRVDLPVAEFQWMRQPQALVTVDDVSAYTPDAPMYRALMSDQLFYSCYESLQLTRTAVPDRPLLSVIGPAQLVDTHFTPNAIDFSVIGGGDPSRLELNYNWSPGWHSTAGPIAPGTSRDVRPSVTLAAGQTGRFTFSYLPPGLRTGTALFLLALAASARLWRATFTNS